MNINTFKRLERLAKRDLENDTHEITQEEVLMLIVALQESQNENHILKERLDNFIPRRRVRRVYKQLKKILEQDGVTDDLDD